VNHRIFSAVLIVGGSLIDLPLARGQNLSVGLIGGGSLTDAARDVTNPYSNGPGARVWSQEKDWIAGAKVEYRFRPHFALEVDGMYRELHLTWASVLQGGILNSVSPSPVVTWEFPILAKYRFGTGRWRPFVETGPSFRTTGNLNFNPSHYGVAAGGGIETRWHGFDFAPTVRYTRWASESSDGRPGSLQPNQLELLLGISRASDSNFNPVNSHVSLGAVVGWGLTTDSVDRNFPTISILPVRLPDGTYTYTQVPGTGYVSGLRSFIAGPSLEVHLKPGLSVEIDALHKLLKTNNWNISQDGVRSATFTATEAAIWQFPVLAKCRFRLGKVTPFVEAGPSFRLPQYALSTHGVTGGAGVAMRVRALKVAPEVRFTHWGAEGEFGFSGAVRNEASLLVGFSFGGAR